MRSLPTILLLTLCAALVAPAFLHPTRNSTDDGPSARASSAHLREKRWVGALFSLGRVAAGAGRAGASLGRLGSSVGRLGSAAGRSALGGARFGSAAASRTIIRAGAGAARVMSGASSLVSRAGAGLGTGARSITNLARSGIRFVGRHPKRIAFELALLGSHIGISELMKLKDQERRIEQTPVPGQNFASLCTVGWSHLESEGLCYVKPEGDVIYPDAEFICNGGFATLATPRNHAQNSKVSSVRNSTVDTWIGLDDRTDEGRFEWVDGESVAYTRWASGYPKPTGQHGYEDCVNMDNEGKWRHSYCLENNAFVCQTVETRAFDVFGKGTYVWELAFRGKAGIQQSVYEAYINVQEENVEAGCRQVKQPNQPCSRHYRNNFVIENWGYIDQVAVVFYNNGDEVAHTIFNGKDTDALNWFSKSKIIKSSFKDIRASNANHASIAGHATVNRRFFLNKSYGGCGADVGWMVALDGGEASLSCPWEKSRVQTGFPAFLYSTSDSSSNWGSNSVGAADTMAIFVKYIDDPQ